jgi:hypothetical protein
MKAWSLLARIPAVAVGGEVKLLACVLLLVPGVAIAGTEVQLQIPPVGSYSGATYRCGSQTCPANWSNRNDLIVSGFTPDGNYLNVYVSGWVAIGLGHGGLKYYHWCGTMEFDLSGNLTQIAVSHTACPATVGRPDPNAVFTNAGGYTGYTTPVYSYGGYFLGYAPHLETP